MLRRKLLLMAFGLIIVSTAEAQNANISTFRGVIESKFRVDLDTLDLCEMIVLNGIPFSETDIDEALKRFEAKDILLTYLGALSDSVFAHKKCSYIIILGTGDDQSDKDKQRILGIIRNNFNTNLPKLRTRDFLCSQCKQVIVDGTAVDPYAAQAMLKKSKVKYIKYIAIYKSADPRIYGQNAENGLVEIYLTAKGK